MLWTVLGKKRREREPLAAAAAAKSLQSCPTLCDPIDGSALGCPVPGILQARTLEWVESLLWICNRSDLGVFSEMQFSFLPNIAYQELKGSQQTTNRKFWRATLKQLSHLR